MTTQASWGDVAGATSALLETAYRLREGDQLADSLCAGWTRGHVLTHLARNADAIGNLVTWAVTGVPTPMYASAEARAEAIQAGAARSVAELVADVQASAARLADQVALLTPEHDEVEIELRGGWRIQASELAWRRLREVAYHHVDLEAGFGFADLPPELTHAFLSDEIAGLREREQSPAVTLRTAAGEEFAIGAGTADVTGSSAALLGWLARGLTDGLSCEGALPHLPKGS